MTPLPAAYPWLPPAPLMNFEFFPGELEALKMKEPLPNGCADHAEKYRVVRESSIPGPWKNENAPYLFGIMQAYSFPWVREITLAKGSQLGGSEIIYNTHQMDVDYEPGPGLVVMPSRDTVKDANLDRVQPMYEDCAPLRRVKSSNPDDFTTTRIRTKNGAVTYFGWAGSDAILASKPIKYAKLDEADLIGRRAINLAVARLRTYKHEYKLLKVSKTSVDTGPIWEDLLSSHVIYDYHVKCPFCGHEQVMTFGQFRWTQGVTDPKRIELTKDAWYECEGCGGKWDEHLRDMATRAAMHDGWKPRRFCSSCHDQQLQGGVCPRCGGDEAVPLPQFPEKIGYHLPAFYSRFVMFHDIVADYLRYQQDPAAKEGDAPSNAEKFWCDDCALPMPTSTEGEVQDEQALYDRREDYAPPGAPWQIPMAACLLTAFVDVQGNRLEVEVEAWGQKEENWGICHEIITGNPLEESTWKKLADEFLLRPWKHESGVTMKIAAMGIDSGYLPDQVYKFAKKWGKQARIYATKGWPVPGKPIKGKPSMSNSYKVPLYMIGTEAAKDTIYGRLTVETPGPYYQHFPRSYGYEFFRQLCAEESKLIRDKRGRSVKVYSLRKGYNRNEALDLRAGNLAVYTILNPAMETLQENLREEAAELSAKQKEPETARHAPKSDDEEDHGRGIRARPGWYGRGR